MATLAKTFAFASTSDGWTLTAGSWDTVAFNSGDGNPAGSIRFNDTGRNDTATTSITWTGTFEDLGIPAGSTITGYSAAAFDHRCGVWNVVDAASLGPFIINDGTARTLVTAVSFTGTTSWVTRSASPGITGLSLPSTTSVTLSVQADGDNGNNSAAQNELRLDNVSLTIDYTEPLAAITGSFAASEASADTFAGIGAVANAPVAGSFATTEAGADTAAISGNVVVQGAIAVAETSADNLAGAGVVLVIGALLAAEAGADTLAASGGAVAQGGMATTESGQDLFAAIGSLAWAPIAGSMSAGEVGADTLSAIGDVLVAGALFATEAVADVFAGNGGAVASGTLLAEEAGADGMDVSGSIGIAGDMSATEYGHDMAAASGQLLVAGLMTAVETSQDTLQAAEATLALGSIGALEVGSDEMTASGKVHGPPEPPPARRTGGGMTATPLRVVPYVPVQVRRPRKRRKIEVLFM